MKINRSLTLKIHFILDNLLPPILRDSKLFMALPFHLIYGKEKDIFFEFKEKAYKMNESEFSALYSRIDKVIPEHETNLTERAIASILSNLEGKNVLEVGAGKAFLANKIQESGHEMTACDLYFEKELTEKYKRIKFVNGNIEHLPFKNKEFDTVICCNTLEHVLDFDGAFEELRRVCRKKLIITVPLQRPYRYTFDLHVQFFPYAYSFLQRVKYRQNQKCEVFDGFIFYTEDMKQ